MKKWLDILVSVPICIGATVILGWAFDIDIFKRPNPAWVSMNPLTAVGFGFIGLSLLLLFRDKVRYRIIVRSASFLISLIGAVKIFGLSIGLDFGLDKILFSQKVASDIINGRPNQMAPNTAFDFLLLGLSVFFLTLRKASLRSASNYLSFVVMLVGIFSVVGYLYQVKEFYGFLSFIPMALPTAICFLFCSFSILIYNGDYAFMRVFTSRYLGGKLARILFPFIILVPVIFGMLRIYLYRIYPVSFELGVGFLITAIILTFFLVVYFASSELDKADRARTKAEEDLSGLNRDLERLVQLRTMELYRSENRFRTIIEQFPYPVLTYTSDGSCTGANLAWEEMWNARRDNLVDYNILKDSQMQKSDLFHHVQRAFSGEAAVSEPYKYDPSLIGKEGRARWMQLVLHPVKNTAGKLLEVIAVQQDITESKEAEDEIRSLNNALEERVRQRTEQLLLANKELESFSYSISHDLRAPIRGINGYTRILEEDYGDKLDAEANRVISKILANAKQMGQLVDDLLEFSRLGRMELAHRELLTKDIVSAVYSELSGYEKNRDIELVVGSLPNVRADQMAFRQLWVNLISNALKYTRKTEKARIEIGSFEENGESIFFIKDNGAGFNMQYYEKIFGVFQRLHSQEDFEGTGVGLAIVNRIVSRHGGRVWAEGEIGKGASFYFTMPGKDSEFSENSTS
ncbi:PAS domain-containing sensor histidine kinase [Leptospira wolffii]|uniref:histidine kinase n=1 Tax=Leptospira wolffii TaxID=409998 RepID=A0A2M9ZGA0_9LEPT|nr:ATP-binding protein [Leptospira wolffii]PJZ67451.1 PAS domain-containing sensor histidine kinase [Leptospira wolffii]